MGDSGPSSTEVAAERRRQDLVAELRVRNPDLYRQYQAKNSSEVIISIFGACVGAGVPLVVVAGMFPNAQGIALAFVGALGFAVGGGVAGLIAKGIFESSQIVDRFSDARIHETMELERMARETNKIISETEAIHIGDTIIAHEGATIFKNSVVVDSFNRYRDSDPELANALKMLVGFVENSKNPRAAEALENLTEDIEKYRHRPSRIRASWNDLVEILPSVATLGTAVATITKLFL